MNIPVGFLGFADAAGAWLLTYLMHSTALLVPALLLCRWLGTSRLSLQESVVRVALIGGLLTASLQVGFGWQAATGTIPYPSAVARTSQSSVDDTLGRAASRDAERDSARRDGAAVTQSTSTEAARARSTRVLWLALAVGLWAAMGTFLVARLGVLAVRLKRTLKGRSELTEGSVFRLFWRLLAVVDVDKPTHLTRSARLDVPIALGVGCREICLPDRVVDELPREQQETVLAHELAHLERRDPIWLLLGRALESVLFVQPLNRVARRKLQEIAEYRCDDWAAKLTGRPLTLAKCLTAVATWSADRRLAALAPTMAGRRSGLGQRVRRLLDPAYSGLDSRVPSWWRPIAAAGLVAVIVAVPGFSTGDQEVAPEAPEPPAEAVEVEPAPDPPEPSAPSVEALGPVVAPAPTPAPQALPDAGVAPVAPPELAGGVPVAPALAAVAPSAPIAPAIAAAPADAPSVVPSVEVRAALQMATRVIVTPEVAPRIAQRVVAPQPAVRVTAELAEKVRTSVSVSADAETRDHAQDHDQERHREDEDWDDDDDEWEWEEELEDDLDELEDELDEVLDEMEETLEAELEMVADELEDELDALEDELEETVEAELEVFEEELEADLEAFEEEMEELEERVEERLETVGWESREEKFEHDLEALEDSFDRFTDQLDDGIDRIEDRIDSQLERILEPLMEHQLEDRIEAIEDRIDAEADRLEEMAERMAEQAMASGQKRLSVEAREELLAEARRVAEAVRPTAEEIAAIRAELDRLSETVEPSREEIDRLRDELREQLEVLRIEAREGLAKQREDLAALRRRHSVL